MKKNKKLSKNLNVEPPLESGSADFVEIPYEFFNKENTIKLLQGQTITISCDIEGDAKFEEAGIKFSYLLNGSEHYIDCIARVINRNQDKKRIWATFKLP